MDMIYEIRRRYLVQKQTITDIVMILTDLSTAKTVLSKAKKLKELDAD